MAASAAVACLPAPSEPEKCAANAAVTGLAHLASGAVLVTYTVDGCSAAHVSVEVDALLRVAFAGGHGDPAECRADASRVPPEPSFPATRPDAPRAAYCFSGHARTLTHSAVAESLRNRGRAEVFS